MSIAKIINVNKVFTNKHLLRGLENISEHGTSFSAGTSLLMSLAIRPLAIYSTPDTEIENKQYAISNSIASALMKFAIVESIALPIEAAIKKIDKNPHKYLNSHTLKNLSPKSYKMLTQFLKLSVGLITAIPKSVLTVAFIPIIMDKVFHINNLVKKNNSKNEDVKYVSSFAGNFNGRLPQAIGKIVDNKSLQSFIIKNQNNDKNLPKHMTAATDLLLTSSCVYATAKSQKIKQNRKRALILNNIFSTLLTLGMGYSLDSVAQKLTNPMVNKFKNLNSTNPKLPKYIEGINILRPAVIFAGIYYFILPIFSTYFSEKIDKRLTKYERNN